MRDIDAMRLFVSRFYAGLALAAGGFTACISAPALAAEPIALSEATDLAEAALAECRIAGYPASVSVVDDHGIVRVVLRDDGAAKTPVAAPLKAATAVAFDQAGSDMEAREKTDPAFAALIAAHHDIYNDHPGSVPLHRDGALVGGLAIADVPHDVADGCVRAALARSPFR